MRKPQFTSAIVVLLALLVIPTAVYFLYPATPLRYPTTDFPFMGANKVNMFSAGEAPTATFGQQAAYKILLLSLVFAFGGLVLKREDRRPAKELLDQVGLGLEYLLRSRPIVCLLLLTLPTITLTLEPHFPLYTASCITALLVLYTLSKRPLSTKTRAEIARIANSVSPKIILFLFAGMLLALALTPNLSDQNKGELALIMHHYDYILSPADKLAAGRPLFVDVHPQYGLLLPVLLGVFQKYIAPIEFGQTIKLFQLIEILYCAVMLWVLLRWARRHRLYLTLPILALTLPYYCSLMRFSIPPNHNPIRSLGIWLMVSALVMIGGDRKTLHFTLIGAISAVGLLNNVESGIAALAGGVCYSLLAARADKVQNLRHYLNVAAPLGVGFTMTIVAFSIFTALLLSPFPITDASTALDCVLNGLAGAICRAFQAPSLSLGMLMTILVSLTLIVLTGDLNRRNRVRLSVGAIFLVWFPYYVSRPTHEYLASYFFLFGLFFIDAARVAITVASKGPSKIFNLQNVAIFSMIASTIIYLLGLGPALLVTLHPTTSYCQWQAPLSTSDGANTKAS